MSRCIGCGVKIQTINPNELGYIPEIALIERGEKVYCQRCYDIIHHNKVYLPTYEPKEYYEKISVIRKEKALVILIIDVLDIYGGFISNINEYIGDNKVLILVNKIDLLPKEFKLAFIESKVRDIALNNKINVESVMMISATNQKDVLKVISKISKLKYFPVKNKFEKYKKTRFGNCYIIGCASVGKSTFMNTIGKLTLDMKKDIITTSSQYQTTLDFIKWPLDQDSYIIDTPGMISPSHFGSYLSNKSLQLLIAKKYLKPRTYQLNPDQTILIGGLARIDFFGDSKINASFYVSNDLYLHRTKTINASDILKSHIFEKFVPPYDNYEIERLGETKEYIFDLMAQSDLYISGIGFIHLTGNNSKIKLIISSKILVNYDGRC